MIAGAATPPLLGSAGMTVHCFASRDRPTNLKAFRRAPYHSLWWEVGARLEAETAEHAPCVSRNTTGLAGGGRRGIELNRRHAVEDGGR
jgi:hypothetical protein